MKKDKISHEIKKIVASEDPKNPYTDIEIADFLKISRSDVTLVRSELKIKDSRERRRDLLLNEIRKTLKEENNPSVRQITAILNRDGYKISRNLVFKFLKEFDFDEESKILAAEDKNKFRAFDTLIGASGSLKAQVELAKAAILYPPNGLHTLIYGPTGVGKSELAECMYNFFIESGIKKDGAPFIVFNCADYAENPQLLLSHLFGYKKGAFTGAAEDKAGLVEKADGGILFLDEIHRLPPEGQEIFFFLMDKGKFRRLGETESERKVNVLLIAATTENIESNLLATFRRRIPIIIELPSLVERPFNERYEILEIFFREEAIRMNSNILVTQNVLKALILYEPPGNIGQIRSDIQVICARSFLKIMGTENKSIKIDIIELPNSVVKGLLKLNSYRSEIDKIVKGDLEIADSNQIIESHVEDDSYILPKEIYKVIEEKYKVMKYQGIDDEIINRIIENELETKIYKSINVIRKNENKVAKSDLEKIVGSKIVSIVEKMVSVARNYYEDLDDSLFYCLTTHLAATYDRLVNNKQINNPKLNKIKMQYPDEFKVAKEMVEVAIFELKVDFPEDEIAFIAMYLKSCTRKDSFLQNSVGIIVLSHGRVAEGMASVANRLLGVNHARAVEMALDQSPSFALNNTMEIAREIANKKGILFLVDMGSLTGFGKIIGDELSIKTRTISRVDTLMVVEAVRKAIMPDSNIDEIADSLETDDKNGFSANLIDEDIKTIICICLTGDGTAKLLRDMIKKKVDKKTEVITMSALENHNVSLTIRNMMQQKRVIAVVGTIDPQIPFIPFIDAGEIIEGSGMDRLDYCLKSNEKVSLEERNNDASCFLVNDLIDENTTIIKADIRSKGEVIEKMSNLLSELGYVGEKFKASVYEREKMNPTTFSGGIALPHGNPKYVIKPIIGILTLQSPILWDEENYVDCIFVVAINEYYKNEFRKLYKIINDSYFRGKIKECRSYDELREVIKNV